MSKRTPPKPTPSSSKADRMELPPLQLRAELSPDTVDSEARTVDVIFSTGAPVLRSDWWSGERYIETLSLEPEAVRLGRLNNGAPFLDTHSSYSLESVLGVIVEGSAKISAKRGVATVRFSKRADVEPVWQDVQDGILRNVSVGYRVHKYEKEEPTDGSPTRMHATDWEPFEISAVPIGADDGSKIRSAEERAAVVTNPVQIIARASRIPQGGKVMLKRVDPNADGTCPEGYELVDGSCQLIEGERAIRPNPADPGAPTRLAPAAAPDAVKEERERATEAERKRVSGIISAVRAARLPSSHADQLIKDGTSLEEARGRVLDQLADDDGPRTQSQGVEIRELSGGIDGTIKRGVSNAMLHRVAPGLFKLEEIGRPYRGLSLIETAKVCLQARGVRTTGMSKMEVAGLALGLHARGGMHTTSDFSEILADVANKTLRQAYQEAPQTFTQISRQTTIPDFKPVRRVQLGEAPALLEVKEHGEYTRGTIGEGKEQYQLASYGRVFAITRKALVNDDTDAFSRLTLLFGRSARNLESDLVWAQITSNPTMGDGTALFHADHGNLAGVAAAISVDSIGIGRASMRKQKGIDAATFLNVVPRFIIVPAGKETLADQLVSTALLATQSSNVNVFAGKLAVIAEPRLDGASATAWYLASSPDQIDIVEYAYLEGESGPVVENRIGFDVDGLEVKCRHDFAAKVIDWRGLFKNAGA